MLSNRNSKPAFRITPGVATHTASIFRPSKKAGFPFADERYRDPAAVLEFLATTGSELMRAGFYRHCTTMMWRPRTPPGEDGFGQAVRAGLRITLHPGDLVVVHERNAAWVVDGDDRMRAVGPSFAAMLGYPGAAALGTQPRATRITAGDTDRLIWVLANTVRGWTKRDEAMVRMRRPIRLTFEDFAKVAITLMDQRCRAQEAGETGRIQDVMADLVIDPCERPAPRTEL